jgi:hypothetical protein
MVAIREPNVTLTKYGEFSVKGRNRRRSRPFAALASGGPFDRCRTAIGISGGKRRSQNLSTTHSRETSVDKQKKTANELEEIVKHRIGAGDFKVTVHRDPEAGWHATIYGRQPAEVHRCQVMADTIAVELSRYYELDD